MNLKKIKTRRLKNVCAAFHKCKDSNKCPNGAPLIVPLHRNKGFKNRAMTSYLAHNNDLDQ